MSNMPKDIEQLEADLLTLDFENTAAGIEEEQKRLIYKGSVAVAGIINELALQKRGLSKASVDHEELTGTAERILDVIGLSDIVQIAANKIQKKPTKEEERIQRIEKGQQIRVKRAELGLSQEELAKRVGLSRFTILRFEHGRQNVSDEHMNKILSLSQ
jgi:DNA-binding XRE family transcriptional regulator